MGVHAITQRQLGNPTTVLPTKVVRYGLVVLCCVCEGLGTITEFTFVRVHKIHTFLLIIILDL